MGSTPKPLAEGRISASEATEIIRQASEIDAAGEYLSVEELRGVAKEAGIDPRATDAAIAEVVGGRSLAVLTCGVVVILLVHAVIELFWRR